MTSRTLVNLIRIYQHCLSPILPKACRFYPSCSEYSVQAIQKHGAAKGLALSLWRLLRCHPFCKGGLEES